jgi:hypothetical protein
MFKIPLPTWIANAAAVFSGQYGDVSAQANHVACSRQSAYDHAAKVAAAVAAEHSGGPSRQRLLEEIPRLRQENLQLWDELDAAVPFPAQARREFAVTAAAMGLSLDQIVALLAIVLSAVATPPGRSTVHRWVQAAALVATRALKRLDDASRGLVLVACLDEIFLNRRPVLVGVEPVSMVWFLGTLAKDCTGTTWAGRLGDWTELRAVLADAGTGLQAGIAQVRQQRHEAGQPELENGLDVFHTIKEGTAVLASQFRRLETLWERAESEDLRVEQAQRQGRDARGAAGAARAAWNQVRPAFGAYEQREAAWKRAKAALQLLRRDGTLNDRGWAEAEIAAAVVELSGPEWAKTRGLLQRPEALMFLDRMHRQLEAAEGEPPLRRELVRLWHLRHRGPRREGVRSLAEMMQRVVCQGLDPNWVDSYRRVARVLAETTRASSAVECMNSVIRMHQARHRTVSQGLLDLKRLYWNCHRFREGKRRGRSPYERLGLKLPSHRFWDVIRQHEDEAA